MEKKYRLFVDGELAQEWDGNQMKEAKESFKSLETTDFKDIVELHEIKVIGRAKPGIAYEIAPRKKRGDEDEAA